ncbi:meiosis protein SPO22/ZIP4 like-domain-containing protein [Lasiosphaeria miniovina]|uniref:Meiosis protein SPO22/ZIP4 like-domain-containing protein n=1 Tax=Lasiosphaeria miniovina TaxID=1954250 RepID=A0AA40A0K0_9PEZI|nr:meiosis protein SPO22/ZIP4 like-domain-containing protein [Lasiosphaeria miniovina]KAK0706965.1 meiosis protein SPO22/ZIP4 like-domain-containing protein [Lasiosphaeria miniovina]
MPPGQRQLPAITTQPGNGMERRIEAVVEFAHELYRVLSSGPQDAPAIDALVDQISKHIDKLHVFNQKYLPGLSGDPEIDNQGRRLWNISTTLRQECDPASKRLGRLCVYARVLAFHLLAISRPKENCRAHDMIHLLKLALKAARNCIGSSGPHFYAHETSYTSVPALATLVLQKAADYKGCLQDLAPRLPKDDADACNCLEIEYFIVRTALSWAENRLDVADHMFTKAECLHKFLTPEYAESLADVLYEIGKTSNARANYPIAIKWLERANEIINGQNLEALSREGRELRLAILQALVTALLGTATPDSLGQAKNYVDFMEVELGNKLVVSLLRLDLLQKIPAEVFDSEGYAEVLRRIIRNFNSSDAGFKLIIHHIRKLHDKSPSIGCAVLDDFIMALVGADNSDWMERAVVTRMWMIIGHRDSVDAINDLQGVFSYLTKPLSAEAAAAAQVLIWKKLESNYSLSRFDLAEKWGNCFFAPLQETVWKLRSYLAFKVAIRIEDRVLAEQCLRTVSAAPGHIDYLGACIAESQKVGDIFCAITALKKLHEKYEYKEPNPIHLPALFRFVLALQEQKQNPDIRKLFDVDELEWFSRNAYNLALKNTATWELRLVVRMLTSCVGIICQFPPDVGSQVELSLKKPFSRFIIASALVSLARTQDNVEKRRHDYVIMREHVMAFDGELPGYLPHLDEQSRDDMIRKHATLLTFDFEAAIFLGQWDDLGGIVQRAVTCRSITAYQAMADSLLRAQAPGQALYSTIRKIVNEIWVLESFDAMKLAKYTRCMFQATLPLDDGLAMKLLDEACSKVRELRESEAHWPQEELEWMATTAFNHAIDCYSAREIERARDWATKAINLSHYCEDEGSGLERTLQDKFLRLNFGAAEPS